MEHALTVRATIARQLGEIEPVRSERDGLLSAISTNCREYHQLLDELEAQELTARPRGLNDALGERPEGRSEPSDGTALARTIAWYRIRYENGDAGDPLGPEPQGGDRRRDYHDARSSREQIGGDLDRKAPSHEIDMG